VLWQTRSHFKGRFHLRTTLADVSYSTKTLVSALLTYCAGTVGKVSVSQTLGPVPLGNWNRADAITTNPFFLLGSAITQAVYPEFRHDIEDRSRTKRVWSDLLGVLGWVCVPLGVFVAVVAPLAAAILLGDGWALAGQYASILAIIGGLQPVVFMLISGFEALGKFSWNWSGYVISLVVNVAAAVVAILLHSIWPVFIGTLVAFAIMHPLHLLLARREGLIDLGRVGRHYAEITAFSVGMGVVLWTLLHVPEVVGVSVWLLVAVLVLAAAAVVVLVRNRDRFPPIVLARRYGILPQRSADATAEPVAAGR
jgi:O-antigen/teichoic acid export membrane protein